MKKTFFVAPNFVVDLGSADEALRQIEEKGYAQPYLADKRKIVCIGVVFSSQTRTKHLTLK